MTNDMDELLRRLRDVPLHPGLEGLDEKVFSKLATLQQFSPATQLRASVFAALGAALLGIASNRIMPQETPQPPLASFAAANPLAPSTLLLGSR